MSCLLRLTLDTDCTNLEGSQTSETDVKVDSSGRRRRRLRMSAGGRKPRPVFVAWGRESGGQQLVSVGHLLCELFHLQLTTDNGPDALIALEANSADGVPGRFALDQSGRLNLPASR